MNALLVCLSIEMRQDTWWACYAHRCCHSRQTSSTQYNGRWPETVCPLLSHMSYSCTRQSFSRAVSLWLDIRRPNAGGLGRNRMTWRTRCDNLPLFLEWMSDELSDAFGGYMRVRGKWWRHTRLPAACLTRGERMIYHWLMMMRMSGLFRIR